VFKETRAHDGSDGRGVGGFVDDGFLGRFLLCCDEFGEDAFRDGFAYNRTAAECVRIGESGMNWGCQLEGTLEAGI